MPNKNRITRKQPKPIEAEKAAHELCQHDALNECCNIPSDFTAAQQASYDRGDNNILR